MEKFHYPKTAICGDWVNNDEVDSACVERLIEMCDDYGEEGRTAKNLLVEVKRLLEIH